MHGLRRKSAELFADGFLESVNGASHVYRDEVYAEVIYELIGAINVKLLARGHQHAENSVLAECGTAERGDHRGVLAPRNADYGVTALSVIFEPLAYPLYASGGGFLNVEIIHFSPFVEGLIEKSPFVHN